MHRLFRYFHTIRHLKFIQIRYQIFYLLRRKLAWKAALPQLSLAAIPAAQSLHLQDSIPSDATYVGENCFSFLNIKHDFGQEIDWNYAAYGKLWTYNLNYFEYLGQPHLSKEIGLTLIYDFIKNEKKLKDGLEPFPTALRTIFWIKFLTQHAIQDVKIDRFLFLQLKLLSHQLEYHLLGNHLLENGFAFLFGAYYFEENSFYKIAKNILKEQLQEQILADGAHFELSPMYHQLMLYRLLDCINLQRHNTTIFSTDLFLVCQKKTSMMLSWLVNMMFEDETLPHFNDSTDGIAPKPKDLLAYAARLKLNFQKIPLNVCGYRKKKTNNYEICIDIANIEASYIPGHTHSDLLHFVLHHQGKPLLVDTGISTYEKNNWRSQERSTAAHNTVQIENDEQSDVWGGFRVGRRAKIMEVFEDDQSLKAAHNGYAHLGILHERTFQWAGTQIRILDRVGMAKNATAYFHFHPNINVELQAHTLSGDFGTIFFENATQIFLENYDYAMGFNLTQKAMVVVVYFDQFLNTTMQLR